MTSRKTTDVINDRVKAPLFHERVLILTCAITAPLVTAKHTNLVPN